MVATRRSSQTQEQKEEGSSSTATTGARFATAAAPLASTTSTGNTATTNRRLTSPEPNQLHGKNYQQQPPPQPQTPPPSAAAAKGNGVSFGSVQVSARKRALGACVVPEEGGVWPLALGEQEVDRQCWSVDDYEHKKRQDSRRRGQAFSTVPEDERKQLFLEQGQDDKDVRAMEAQAKVTNRALKKWRKEAAKSTQGCSCSHSSNKKKGGRLSKKALEKELRQRGALPKVPQSLAQLQKLWREVKRNEPCCATQDCPCVQSGISCQANACGCWLHLPDDEPPPAAIEAACGNPSGIKVYNEEQVQAYVRKYKTAKRAPFRHKEYDEESSTSSSASSDSL